MQCQILRNCGLCYGVNNAIRIALETKKKYPNKRVYILGMLVHNEKIIQELTNQGINTLNVNSKDYELALSFINEGDVVIFSAHGHDEKLDEICKNRNIIYVDAICPMVKQCQILIKQALAKKNKIIYIGIKDHSETNAMLSLNKDIIFIPYNQPINYQFSTKYKYFCINQTTLSFIALQEIYNYLKANLPHLEIADEICEFTKNRQQELLNIKDEVDGIIIVGSIRSSNTTRLYELCKQTYPLKKIYFVNDFNELDINEVKTLKNVVLAGGTSTDIRQLQDIKNKLLNIK